MASPDNTVVLVADSEASIVKEIASTLEKAGFTIVAALGREQVEELCERKAPVDLAIVDVSAPGNSDLVAQLSQCYPDIRMLLTGNKDESKNMRQLGRSGQIREFLRKPFRRSQLLGRVLKVMDEPMVHTA